jgi:NADH-quinone oxidoreductase subunit E
MLPEELQEKIAAKLGDVEHPREKAIDIMYLLQAHFGYMSDEAVFEAAAVLAMTPLEIDELATFYDFIYRQPVGKYVIHVCDGVVCWMCHYDTVFTYLCRKLGVDVGETTPDNLFTVLPTACIGDCHNGPSMLINGQFYGKLTPQKIDEILDRLARENFTCIPNR